MKVKVLVTQSCPLFCDPMDYIAHQTHCPWNSPSKNTGVGSHSLLQGIFLTQGSNPGLLHCRQILYCLSHQGRLHGVGMQKQVEALLSVPLSHQACACFTAFALSVSSFELKMLIPSLHSMPSFKEGISIRVY